MFKKSLTYLAVFCLTSFASAQKIDTEKLDLYIKALEDNNKFMGSLAIAQNGEIVYTKSVGYIDLENKIKANENSKYRIGSISKTFTTVLVMKAVEDKKLSLDQTIKKYFPAIKNADKITVRHLLNHRSGIQNFTDDTDYLTWNTKAMSEKDMLDVITKGGSDFEPDSKGEYSNSNFVLLTFILEKTFKKSYAELLTSYITKPLGLSNTYLGGKINVKNNEAKSYDFEAGWKPESETDISIPLGAGGILSTPSDLTKFSDALFTGKLLKKESVELMQTIKDGYGLGLFQVPFYDKKGYGHSGGIDGFSSTFSRFESGNVTFALTSNASNFNNNNIAIAALSAVYNKPFDIPDFRTYENSTEDLDVYLGTYASTQIPIKITVTKNNQTLIAQATGQPSFSLEAVEKHKFKFDQAGIVMEFNPDTKTFVLKQRGGEFIFTKE
ncbi:serine hydrolase domain-containing protein [Sphingobacterium spiritivorum]|uniref:serine hydrolase domain-containing protein n=1 Tax=Sphingobacterium spiritivorum TaxID=258 RepID=UPI00191989FC|nr:serine hydrolase domain-containing protein [Sphingobacterium spiritivorum]QQT25227.1 beta-lactamase family protein [Sphingobacterium spiritivorum]